MAISATARLQLEKLGWVEIVPSLSIDQSKSYLAAKVWLDTDGDIEQFLTCQVEYHTKDHCFVEVDGLYETGREHLREEFDWLFTVPRPSQPGYKELLRLRRLAVGR